MNGSAVPAALDAAGEVDPNPGVGRDAAGRQPGTPPSRGEGQKGVQDTRTCVPVSYTPSCDSP